MEEKSIDLIDLITVFYEKAIKKHHNRIRLQNKYEKFIGVYRKASYNKSPQHNNRWTRDLSERRSYGISIGTDHSKDSSKLNVSGNEQVYSTSFFYQIFAYGYIDNIVKNGSDKLFKMIDTKINLLTESEKFSHEKNSSKSLKDWNKILQLINHKMKYSENILRKMFKDFNQEFLIIIISAILNLDRDKAVQIMPTRFELMKISNQLKISIKYKEVDSANHDQISVGQYSNTLYFNFSALDHKYFIPEHPNNNNQKINSLQKVSSAGTLTKNKPLQQRISDRSSSFSKDESKTKIGSLKNLVRRKAIRTIEVLIKQYDRDDLKLSELECLKTRRHSFGESRSDRRK